MPRPFSSHCCVCLDKHQNPFIDTVCAYSKPLPRPRNLAPAPPFPLPLNLHQHIHPPALQISNASLLHIVQIPSLASNHVDGPQNVSVAVLVDPEFGHGIADDTSETRDTGQAFSELILGVLWYGHEEFAGGRLDEGDCGGEDENCDEAGGDGVKA